MTTSTIPAASRYQGRLTTTLLPASEQHAQQPAHAGQTLKLDTTHSAWPEQHGNQARRHLQVVPVGRTWFHGESPLPKRVLLGGSSKAPTPARTERPIPGGSWRSGGANRQNLQVGEGFDEVSRRQPLRRRPVTVGPDAGTVAVY